MHTLLKTKIGPFLVISSVLAVWTLLIAQPVQAHTTSIPSPSCGGLPTAAGFYTSGSTIAITATSVTPRIGTGGTSGNSRLYYARITAPALTAGVLTVSDSGAGPSDAALCGRQEGPVTSRTSYTAHNAARSAAAAADRAADNTSISESSAKGALRTAATALNAVATALTAAGNDAATTAATTATTAATTAATAATAAADQDSSDERVALGIAADALEVAADAFHMGFSIDTVISSGDEEYVVVVAVPEGASAPALTVGFAGVSAATTDAQNGQDRGSFTQNNQRITHTLTTTADTPGLLTVHTRGSAVRTKGTLADSTPATVAEDEGSGGNFRIVAPVEGGATYELHVEGQTRSERGGYDLKVEFGVATPLTIGTAPDATALKRGRADYFFFAIAADAHGFLTVQTQMPTAVTRETDTTGALFSTEGMVVSNTNSGTGNNFLFRVPVVPGDYIVEVKGASSSTEGAYTLVTNRDPAPTRGSAPDEIMVPTTGATIGTAGEVDPHSITVTKAGTLQVKTRGTTDTVGVLYGSDGRQIATDDNSADGMRNFLITEYVEAGHYIVTVEGQSRSVTSAAYVLVVNFVEGATIDGGTGTGPGTGTETEEELRDQIADLQEDLDACLMLVETDARGVLGNPPDGGFRSGVGVISGWVCSANEVEVLITSNDRQGSQPVTLNVAYGTSRPDVPENSSCNNENAGFGMTYNFNQLREGAYTIRAFADGEEFGDPHTFEVVHLTTFALDDENRFLRDEDLLGTECRVDGFPELGEATILEWEQSTQNFTIIDAGPVSQ